MTIDCKLMDNLNRSPYNVLLFSSYWDLGHGGQESLFQLAKRLDKNRFNPIVIAPKNGLLSKSLTKCGIEVHLLNLPKVHLRNTRAIISSCLRLIRLIKKRRIAIMHGDGPRNVFYAGILGFLMRIPILWHVRSSEKDRYDNLLAMLSSKMILVACSLHDRFPSAVAKKKCIVIHNGVDLDLFSPNANASANGKKTNLEVLITNIGRVEREKGQLDLIKACGKIAKEAASLRVMFAGEIKNKAYLKQCLACAKAMNIADRVRFLGKCGHVNRLLKKTDIYVLSSLMEAFPRSVLEAMAAGKPVVATDCGGTAEAVIDGTCGFVVPIRDVDAMADKIKTLVLDMKLRRELGMAARKRAETMFGIDKNIERTVAVYEEVLT